MRNVLVFILVLSFSCSSLSQNIDDYRKGYTASYKYVERTIHLKGMIDTLKNACLKLGATPDGFSATLHVSQREIPNNINLVLCDYIKKKYNVPKGCARLFGANLPIVQHVRDSINMSNTKGPELKGYSVREIIPEYLSRREKGYIVFFPEYLAIHCRRS